jgi:hypothetical protein
MYTDWIVSCCKSLERTVVSGQSVGEEWSKFWFRMDVPSDSMVLPWSSHETGQTLHESEQMARTMQVRKRQRSIRLAEARLTEFAGHVSPRQQVARAVKVAGQDGES